MIVLFIYVFFFFLRINSLFDAAQSAASFQVDDCQVRQSFRLLLLGSTLTSPLECLHDVHDLLLEGIHFVNVEFFWHTILRDSEIRDHAMQDVFVVLQLLKLFGWHGLHIKDNNPACEKVPDVRRWCDRLVLYLMPHIWSGLLKWSRGMSIENLK